MNAKMNAKEWYEKNYKGIWCPTVFNDRNVLDAWRNYLQSWDGKAPKEWYAQMAAQAQRLHGANLGAAIGAPTTDAKLDSFIEQCGFASQVSTANGPALLIGGEVITIVSSNPAFHADALSSALRRSSRKESGISFSNDAA